MRHSAMLCHYLIERLGFACCLIMTTTKKKGLIEAFGFEVYPFVKRWKSQ